MLRQRGHVRVLTAELAARFARLALASIATALPRGDARIAIAEAAASQHLDAGLAGVASGEYVGDHWLATFAVLALG